MASFSQNQQQFLKAFSSASGINPGVAAAWMAAEQPVGSTTGDHGTQNWLNIGNTDSGSYGVGADPWKNPVTAGIESAKWLKGQISVPGFGHAAPGIVAITRTPASNPGAQIRAIQNSGWATSHYPDLPGLYTTYGQQGVKIVGSGGGMPAMPATSGGVNALKQMSNRTPSSTLVSKTTQGFDQLGYQAAKANAIAGQYLAGQSKDPYAVGAPKTGLSTGAASNPLLSSGQLSTVTPNPADYQTVQTKLQRVASTGGGAVKLNQHPAAFQQSLKGSGYTNPLPGATWERTDMGVDASLPNGAPIKALGDSKLVNIYPNWYKGQPYLEFKLLNGPQAGKTYYVAEAINPTVKVGQTVRSGQTIGTYNSGGTGLELGWGRPGGRTLAQATTGYTEGQQTQAGKSFRNFLNGIGAHAG